MKDETTTDIDDLSNKEIKINPDFYIHRAILKAQDALSEDNVEQGFLRYFMIIEHAETLARAASMLDEEYYNKLSEYKKKIEKEKNDKQSERIKISHKKLELILDLVFKNKTLNLKMEL